jgi:biotin-[acetyl-CoA-carboxylase] ligase BirA-like protein
MQIPSNLTALGDTLLTFVSIDSTMDEARRRFDPSKPTRLWIIAGEQNAGRGRIGRQWQSPAGNLHMTLLLPTQTPLRDQPKFGFVAGVALAHAVASLLPDQSNFRLKWPNDLLMDGAKVSGLLLEGLGQGAAVAIGIGINIVAHPPDTPYLATHLRMASPDITRESLFGKLAIALVEELDIFAGGSGFPLTRQRWLARAAHLGQSIRVRQGETVHEGIFRDIDAQGRLLLETSGGLARIDAGDVFPLDK